MPARTTPSSSRARLHRALDQALDRLLPSDEKTPLRLQTFAEFEDATEQHAMPLLGMILEELSALRPEAEAQAAGCCPHCSAANTRLDGEATQREVRSRWGPVVYAQQRARCRSCGAAFSPSGS